MEAYEYRVIVRLNNRKEQHITSITLPGSVNRHEAGELASRINMALAEMQLQGAAQSMFAKLEES